MAMPPRPNQQKYDCGTIMVYRKETIVLLMRHRSSTSYYVEVVNTGDEKSAEEHELTPFDAKQWIIDRAERRLEIAKSREKSEAYQLDKVKKFEFHKAVTSPKLYKYDGRTVKIKCRHPRCNDHDNYDVEDIDTGEVNFVKMNQLCPIGDIDG